MKNYIEEIKNIVLNQMKNNENFETGIPKLVFNIYSFGTNEVYYELCKTIDRYCSENKIKFVAKMSREKYELDLKNKNSDPSNYFYMKELDNNNWVEKDDTLTKWRNLETEEQTIIFLMGSELVQDKGGLHDFFTITPEKVDIEIGENYRVLFAGEDFLTHVIGNEKIIDNFFKNLFRKIPKNLLKLSYIVDEISELDSVTNLDDIFKIIGERFNKDWSLPIIFFNCEQLTYIKNSKGKIPILDKIVKFKDRKDFEGITEKKYEDFLNKIEAFEKNNEWDTEKFGSFEDFKKNLISFITGKNLQIAREKLYNIDFNIINTIIDIKLPSDPKPEKETIGKLRGEPLVQILKAFALLLYAKTKKKIDEIDYELIETTDIKIKVIEVATKENTEAEEEISLLDPWKNISRYLGGIFAYINDANIFLNSNGENIRISYDDSLTLVDKDDFFDKENYKKLKDKNVIKKISDDKTYSSISFILTAYNSKIEEKNMEFKYEFLSNDLWIQEFSYFDEIINKMETSSYLPMFTSNTLDRFLYVNDEEEFANTLTNCELKENGNFFEKIYQNSSYQNSGKFNEDFMKLGMIFKELVILIENNGYFKILSQQENNKILEFIRLYNTLAEKLRDSSPSESKQLINCFINLFMVLENKESFFEIGSIRTALSLSLHPAMLEKSYDRNRFLIDGFKECINEIKEEKMKKKRVLGFVDNKIERISNFSTISSSIDILPKTNTGNYTEVESSYGMFTFFKNDLNLRNNKTILSLANLSASDVSINEDIDEKEFAKVSSYSKIIYKTIHDYLKLFSPLSDGLELLFINPYSLQHIVAALEEIIKSKEISDIVESGLKIRLNIMQDKYNLGGENYLANWVNYISNDPKAVNIKIEVYYSNFSNTNNVSEELLKISKNKYSDIIFIGNILREISIVFDSGEKYFNSLYDIKFPRLYKPILVGKKNRKVEISQPQFEASTLHAQLCYKISNDQIDSGYEDKFLYRELDFSKAGQELINEAHKKGRWVLCLDKSIDKELLLSTDQGNKIISFTTGEGPFGEYNTTLSTNYSNLNELERKLKIKLRDFLLTDEAIEEATKKVMEYSNEIEGITLLKAINLADRQINKYLTFIALNEYLNIKNSPNKILINLDAYRHWFINGEKFPDYLEIEINNEEGQLSFNAKIIECKLGKESFEETTSAKEQIISGYKRLKSIFDPTIKTTESRYWNSQLYRILLYSLHEKSNKNNSELKNNLEFLKKILEGNYLFSWKGENIYFVTNIYSDQLNDIKTQEIEGIEIIENKVGKDVLLKLLTSKNISDFENSLSPDENIQDSNQNKSDFKELQIIKSVPEEFQEVEISKDYLKKNIENKDLKIAETELPDFIKTSDISNKNRGILRLIEAIYQESSLSDIVEEENYAKEQLIKLLGKLREAAKLQVSPYQGKGYDIGPNFIRIKLVPEGTTKVNNIKNAYDDIKVWLSLRETPYIFADAGYISIDIPRLKPATINFSSILKDVYEKGLMTDDGLKFMIGVDELYNPIILDMQDSNNPHMLIAGQSGSGKSVLINCIILNAMLNHTPDQIKMLLIDPKKVELIPFKESPFLYKPIIQDIGPALNALTQLTIEMDRRYNIFVAKGAKDLKSYNNKTKDLKDKLPRILVVFDEFGEFMAQDKKIAAEIENKIIRLAQKGRASGIHLIIATQSPKAEIITTTIKNNLPSRVALSVPDSTASQVVLDSPGAENLYGKGDLLFTSPEYKTPKRLRSAFIDEDNQEILLEKIKEYYEKR